jgi:peptidoglycan/LPS O-acetylase OafA/YrhL
VARVGLASYGIYLWHTVVLHFVAQNHLWVSTDRMGILALPLNVMLVLGLTLPIATASWLLVEKRSLAWAERVARQWRGAAQPDVQPRVEPEAEAVPVPASGG